MIELNLYGLCVRTPRSQRATAIAARATPALACTHGNGEDKGEQEGGGEAGGEGECEDSRTDVMS